MSRDATLLSQLTSVAQSERTQWVVAVAKRLTEEQSRNARVPDQKIHYELFWCAATGCLPEVCEPTPSTYGRLFNDIQTVCIFIQEGVLIA
jgi:hypothetical protein